MFCSQTSLYGIGLVGRPFFKCDEMRLRWVFTAQTAVILLKNLFEFTSNKPQSTIYRSLREKGFNHIVWTIFTVCQATWPSSNDLARRGSELE